MDKGTVQQLCFVLALLLFGALFMVSVTTWYIHEYRGERFFATGRLESVAFDIAGTGNYVLELGVNGERYEIMRPSNAVSYTHLDVYKRQDWEEHQWRRRLTGP